MPENNICAVFALIFSPFPAIIYTQGQMHYVPIDLPSHGTAGHCLDLEGKVWEVGDGRTRSTSDRNDMEDVEFTGGSESSSSDQEENSGNGEDLQGSQMPGGGHELYGGDDDDNPNDDDDDDGNHG